MHPVENIRGVASDHLAGRKIVLGVAGSIGAVKCVELARELIRHGADVHAVMTGAAQGIITPDALEFGTGHPVVTRLTGQVEHVQLLGDVREKADLLLIAPATANTVSKMAQGIDDTTVTTCATVAFGTQTPVVVAPAMHEAMLDHPIVAQHARTLIEDLDVTWVEPQHDEKKAKLADIDAIVDAVIHRLNRDGPLGGKRALVIGGATAEPVDPVRVLTNRSSGRSALILARELRRHGADVELWYGHASQEVPACLRDATRRFASHADLMGLVHDHDVAAFDQVWMPAAIGDYAAEAASKKIPSEQDDLTLPLRPLGKVIEAVREQAPETTLVAFKAESDATDLAKRAHARLDRYGAQWIVANTAEAFGADETDALLLGSDGSEQRLVGRKDVVLRDAVRIVAAGGASPVQIASGGTP